jgi:hypothetical protein
MMNKTNARFWMYINGSPVKITLEPGQQIEWYQAHPDEEGFSYRSELLYFNGAIVQRDSMSGGRDCDGRIDRCKRSECVIQNLKSCLPYYGEEDESMLFPEWAEVGCSVYDENAQKAGY